MLFAHSLGTGAASAVAGIMGDELACACLVMPFSTMTSTALEYQWYGGWPWQWLGDTYVKLRARYPGSQGSTSFCAGVGCGVLVTRHPIPDRIFEDKKFLLLLLRQY